MEDGVFDPLSTIKTRFAPGRVGSESTGTESLSPAAGGPHQGQAHAPGPGMVGTGNNGGFTGSTGAASGVGLPIIRPSSRHKRHKGPQAGGHCGAAPRPRSPFINTFSLLSGLAVAATGGRINERAPAPRG
ncbi:hypothetical protein AAFF_G00283690 [Aldrovandia affinis]|uniref:Uncharacterized protein n=1 Tax=Aldrovandia affinis TaxID=143900 RepID=A0AAD7TAP8_9TELE|nr:hypothetical protein AAFF_G00283690 [Aldrovandia affinis]